jgi:hypothetical protein
MSAPASRPPLWLAATAAASFWAAAFGVARVTRTFLDDPFGNDIRVLAAWLVLRTGPGLAHRLWLVAGIPACQFTAIGLPLPQLLWQTVWLGLLARDGMAGRQHDMVLADKAQ